MRGFSSEQVQNHELQVAGRENPLPPSPATTKGKSWMGVHVSEVMVPVPAMKFGKEMGMHFLSPDMFRYCKIYLYTIEVKPSEQFNFMWRMSIVRTIR
jgi:hypothetical protein